MASHRQLEPVMRAQHEVALRAREKGRALARIAVAANESGTPDYRQLFDAFAAAADAWRSPPVPVNTPYYALVAEAYRDEVQRLLAGSPPPDLHHSAA
jgi:hypothetical protein